MLTATWLVVSIIRNPNLHHPTIARFLTSRTVLGGLWTTVVLANIAMALGTVLGLAVAVMRRSANPVARWFAAAYVWLLRGTPLLVQILVWGNLALFWPRIYVGVPGTSIFLIDYSTNNVVTPFIASLLALALNEAAYMAEIFRGGLLSIDRGQHEAAWALGLSPVQEFQKVVLPQVLRVIVPPTGNQFINMLKMTSLVSVIAGGDLLTQAQNISAGNLRTFELLVVASFWYLVVTSVANLIQMLLERRAGRSTRRTLRVAVSGGEGG